MDQAATRENYALAVSNAIWVLDELGDMLTKIMTEYLGFALKTELR